MSRNHAIVIGLNRYPGISHLNGPENDAKWFHEWLIRTNQVDTKDADLILTSDFEVKTDDHIRHAQPGTGEVDRAFERLIELSTGDSPVGKRLYIFIAGHGFAVELDDGALLMPNVDIGKGVTGHHIIATSYADYFAKSAMFDEVLLFMDCCRDEQWKFPQRVPPFQRNSNVDGKDVRRFYGLATKWTQKARELPDENGKTAGNFTRTLRAAVEGGAVDKDGDLWTHNIRNFAFSYMSTVIGRELDVAGLPRAEPHFVRDDNFRLLENLKPTLTPVTVNFHAPASGFICTGGKPSIVKVNSAGENPWTFHLPFGRYSLLQPDGETQVTDFAAFGQEITIDV